MVLCLISVRPHIMSKSLFIKQKALVPGGLNLSPYHDIHQLIRVYFKQLMPENIRRLIRMCIDYNKVTL